MTVTLPDPANEPQPETEESPLSASEELTERVNTLTTTVNDLQQRLTAAEQTLAALLPLINSLGNHSHDSTGALVVRLATLYPARN